MKKIPTEVRVGLVAIAIIVLFFWLFSFLKGKNILNSADSYSILYDNIAGLEESNPVEINGLKAGIVSDVRLVNNGEGQIVIEIGINHGIRLPQGTIAEISAASLLGGMKLNLLLGDDEVYLEPGDTLPGVVAVSMVDKLDENFDPVIDGVSSILGRMDSLMTNLNMLFSADFADNINSSSENFKSLSSDLRKVVSENREDLTEIIADLNSFSEMLNNNRNQIDSTFKNLNQITGSLADSNLDSSLVALNNSLISSREILDRLNNGEGTAGKLLEDDSLYFNLTNSLESLNLLLIDLEKNPGRYVNFSIFGKKHE